MCVQCPVSLRSILDSEPQGCVDKNIFNTRIIVNNNVLNAIYIYIYIYILNVLIIYPVISSIFIILYLIVTIMINYSVQTKLYINYTIINYYVYSNVFVA